MFNSVTEHQEHCTLFMLLCSEQFFEEKKSVADEIFVSRLILDIIFHKLTVIFHKLTIIFIFLIFLSKKHRFFADLYHLSKEISQPVSIEKQNSMKPLLRHNMLQILKATRPLSLS